MGEYLLEILTDTFIGSGEKADSFEYIINRERKIFSLYNFNKFIDFLYENNDIELINELVRYLGGFYLKKSKKDKEKQRRGEKQVKLYFSDIFNILKDNNVKRSDFLLKNYVYYGNVDKSSILNLFMNSGNNNFIPGGSIKGVIRNALANEIYLKFYRNSYLNKEVIKNIENRLDKIFKKEYNKNLLIVRDVYREKKGFVIVELKNFMGQNKGLELYEVLRGVFNEERKHRFYIEMLNFKEEWFEVINRYSESVINLEIKFIENKINELLYKNNRKPNMRKIENYKRVKENYEKLKMEIKNLGKSEAIFPIGQHTGWVSKSIPSFYEFYFKGDVKRIENFRLKFEKEVVRLFYENRINLKKRPVKRYDLGMKSLAYDHKFRPVGWVKLSKDE